jgi:NAD(P)H dehydrogenase (quinone)
MHVLCVLCHPDRQSFTGAVLDAFLCGLAESPHSAEIADLYREDFNPVLGLGDFAQFDNRPMPEDVGKEQARVERSDAIVLVFPLWWYSMPAMLKGWLDRVFCAGWAYQRKHDPEGSLLKTRRCTFLVSTGSSQKVMDRHHYDQSLDHLWRKGVLGYVGADPIDIHFLLDATWNSDMRRQHLDRAYRLGREFGADCR